MIMTTFYNKASLLYNGTVTTSNTVSGTIADAIEITKTPLISSYALGNDVTYIVSITTGGKAISGITITDDLGRYEYGEGTLVPLTYTDGSLKYYVGGALMTTPSITATSPLTISGIDIPANGNAMLIYSAKVNEQAPLSVGSTITNSVSASGASCSGAAASSAINALEQPILSVIKALEPAAVDASGSVTYTLTISNSGNTALTQDGNAIISDVFTPPLELTSVTLNGTALSSPTDYTYNAATGEFSTVGGQITVPAAEFSRDTAGALSITPGTSVLKISGIVRCGGQ